jgi:pyrimidine-specific ribonucleoside hydrolase
MFVEKKFVTSRRELIQLSAGAIAPVLYSGAMAQTNGGPRRVIIDTDPGTDDALAIFLALKSPELKVEAITPVAGNVPLELTLPNALRLVEIADRTDIPVAAGASKPLVRRLVTASYAHGENGLGGVVFPEPKTKPIPESAGQLIRRMIRSAPHEIGIIALGPLTNLALAFRDDPELPSLIPNLTIMGGSLSGGNVSPSAEFNIYVDPEAADVVFRSGVPLTMVGLDVTRKAMIREQDIQALDAASNRVSRAAGQIVRATMTRMRKANSPLAGPAMHDSLAMATFIDPSLVTLQDYFVTVETAGEYTAGETVGYRRAPMRKSAPMANAPAMGPDGTFRPNSEVATEVDVDRFLRMLVGRLTA